MSPDTTIISIGSYILDPKIPKINGNKNTLKGYLMYFLLKNKYLS